MSNYRAYFKDIDEATVKVDIITNPLDSTYTELKLSGESPVTISYTTSDKLFSPLRTSTCTISILTEGYPLDIYTGKAQGTRVDVSRDTYSTGYYELLWTGYLQPNIYSQDYSDPVSVLDLEASDIISTCQYFDYEILGEKKQVVTFDSILKRIFERFPSIRRYVVSQGVKYRVAPDVEIGLNLSALGISENNFFSTEDEPWSLKEVLEEISKYFGFTAFQEGDTVYFIDYSTYDDSDRIDVLSCRKTDGQNRWGSLEGQQIGSSFEITEDMYRMTGGTMSLDDLYNKVQVRDNFYELKEIVPPLLDDKVLVPFTGDLNTSKYKLVAGKNPNNEISNPDNVIYFFWKNKKWRNIHYDYIWSLPQPVDDAELEIPVAKVLNTDAMTRYRGSNFVSLSYQNVSEEGMNTPAKFQKYLHISHLNGGGGSWSVENNHPMVETTDVPAVAFGGGKSLVLNLKYMISFWQNRAYVDPHAAKEIKKVSGSGGGSYQYDGKKFTPSLNGWVRQVFYLRLGGKWYNGSGWQDTKTGFWVEMTPLAYSSYFNTDTSVENGIIPELWMSTEGYKIDLPENGGITNDFYFAIGLPNWLAKSTNYEDFHDAAKNASWGTAHMWISDFSLDTDYQHSYFDNNGRKGLEKPDKDDNIFENIIDVDNVLEMSPIELKITTDNGKGFSFSNVVIRPGGEYEMLKTLHHPKFIQSQKPEENIIERYVRQYSTPTIREDITISTSPHQYDVIKDPFWKNQKFFILGTQIDLAMNRQTISLIEKKF